MRAVAFVACLGLVLVVAMTAAAQEPSRWLAVVGATVLDGTGTEPRPDATILMENERIAQIGGGVVIPDGATVIDAAGKWVIPGLIDAQVNLFQSGGLYSRPDIIDLRKERSFGKEVADVRKALPATFARYIASGVTGIIDVGGPFWTFDVRTLASGIPRAPRIAVTGPLLAAAASPVLSALDDPPVLQIISAEQAGEVIDRLLGYKPDLIAIRYAVGAGVTPARAAGGETAGAGVDQTAAEAKDAGADGAADGAGDGVRDWVHVVIGASDAANVPVAAEVGEVASAYALLAAGVDVLVPGFAAAELDDAVIAPMERNGVVYVTALVVDEGYREVFGRHVRLLDIERQLADPVAVASFDAFDGLPEGMVPEWVHSRPPQPLDARVARNLRRLQAAGITLAAGTDAGSIGTPHGPALHRELELMVAAGLSPAQALVAATRGGAAAMGRLEELGTLEVGKLADLVILDGDPLKDIANTQRIHRVVKGGIVFDPAEIAAELDDEAN